MTRPAINSAIAVIDKATGQQLMHVIDANDHTDPAWNPPGSVIVHLDHTKYHTMDHLDLDAHVVAQGAAQGAAVKSRKPPAVPPK